MNERQRRCNERAQRVVVYLDAQAEEFPPESKGAILAARLKEHLAQAAALDAARAAHARKRQQGTEGRLEARTAVRRMNKLVWDTYQTIARERHDIRGLFESPSRIKNDQALVAAARAAADAAVPFADLFAEYGLTAAFFSELRAKADSLEANATLQNAGVGASVDAHAAIAETFRLMDEVIERLDTVVTNKFRDNPAKLAAWESARRLERPRRSRPTDEDADTPPPPPANG
jgi:hypothetical protein